MNLTAAIIKKPTTMRVGAVTGETNKGSLPPVGFRPGEGQSGKKLKC
jgi:hypothetical protein